MGTSKLIVVLKVAGFSPHPCSLAEFSWLLTEGVSMCYHNLKQFVDKQNLVLESLVRFALYIYICVCLYVCVRVCVLCVHVCTHTLNSVDTAVIPGMVNGHGVDFNTYLIVIFSSFSLSIYTMCLTWLLALIEWIECVSFPTNYMVFFWHRVVICTARKSIVQYFTAKLSTSFWLQWCVTMPMDVAKWK